MRGGSCASAALLLLAGCGTTEVGSADLIGPTWAVEQLAGAALPGEPAVTLTLGADGSAGGSGGCNSYGGSYEIAGGGIRFGEIVSTRMACEPAIMDREQAFLAALAAVDRYELRGETELVLLAEGGARLRLRRVAGE
jgi:heat shock protein HslJ